MIATPVDAAGPVQIEPEDPIGVEAAIPVDAEHVSLVDEGESSPAIEEEIRSFEHVENRGFDPDDTLVAIDALIADELVRAATPRVSILTKFPGRSSSIVHCCLF